jgi:Amt family ammonium transporter
MLVACALVLLMTPALAFFYGGLVAREERPQHDGDELRGVRGGGCDVGGRRLQPGLRAGERLAGRARPPPAGGRGAGGQGTIPHLLFFAYQGTFAIITAALISGAVVERMRFSAYLVFIACWTLLVYAPVCHWVWGGGWLQQLGALDFAGGTVVHVNAGMAALVAAFVLGARKDYGHQALLPHNVPFVLLGAALLWFGWLGFNGGSALSAGTSATLAFVNTMLAPCATLSVWMALDQIRTRRVTAVGVATGIVVGLVAVTPAAGFISPRSALLLGALAALPSYWGIVWRARTKLDDSLDVSAAHGLGGVVGALLTGVLRLGGLGRLPGHLGVQAMGVLAAIVYSGRRHARPPQAREPGAAAAGQDPGRGHGSRRRGPRRGGVRHR